jgi:type IV pilus assembly protein PilN
MIKINLLPSKKKPPKKVTDLQKQVFLFVLVSTLVGAGIFFFWRYQVDMIEGLNREKVAADAKAREQETMLKEVKNVEEERKKVSEKIDIIEKLKKDQAGPVRLLDEISIALPRGVNIASFTESGSNLNLEGDAFTNDDVVRFIDNLKASRFLTGVVLLETSQTKKEGIDMYRYKLQFAYKGL